MSKAPVRVLISGAAGQIANNMIPLFCTGEVLGPDTRIILHLLDIPRAAGALEGVAMELHDGAYPLLAGVVATVDPAVGFKGVEVAVLLGGFPRLDGMTRADLLEKNCAIFKLQGKALADHANPNCKVVVVANPANTNCLIAYKAAGGKLPRENFSALTRLDQNRAVGQLAKKMNVPATDIEHVVIWGNHSADQYPDISRATVLEEGGKEAKVTDVLKDEKEYLERFAPLIQTRGAAVIKARGKSSAMSAANATKDHLKNWIQGTPGNTWASMSVLSDGSYYGIPKNLIFSVPVTCKGGSYTVVKSLTLTEVDKERLAVNVAKLTEEFDVAQKFL